MAKNEKADLVLLTNLLNHDADKRIDILRRVDLQGSISEAARSAGVSYKAAYMALETLGNLAGGSLVEKTVGGSTGGGTRLTTVGKDVLEIADELARARMEVLSRYKLQGTPNYLNIGASTLRTSMRNQFPATIKTIKLGSALVRLILEIDDTHLLRASVTKESAQLLSLREGLQVLALSKATAVEIASDMPNTTENVLVGEVIHSERAAHGGECTLRLSSGITVSGFAKAQHGLHINDRAFAHIPAVAIVIALAG